MNTELRASRKQREIIETAISLFKKYTVRKTSMDDIAEAAGASKVTLYKYFGDKQGLCRAVYAHISDNFGAETASRVLAEASLKKKLMNYTSVYSGFISGGLWDLCVQLAAQCAEVAHCYASFQLANQQLIKELIARAKAEGAIDRSIDDDVAYHYIDMGFSYFLNDERYRNRMQSDADFRNKFLEFIWRNIFLEAPCTE